MHADEALNELWIRTPVAGMATFKCPHIRDRLNPTWLAVNPSNGLKRPRPVHHSRTGCRWEKVGSAHARSSSGGRWPRPFFFSPSVYNTHILKADMNSHITLFHSGTNEQIVNWLNWLNWRGDAACVSWTSDNWRSGHSPTDTSCAKAREMRNKGIPTARSVTILSGARSRRSPLYLDSVGPFSKKSEKTYSAATVAIAMAAGDRKPVLSNWWGNCRAF